MIIKVRGKKFTVKTIVGYNYNQVISVVNPHSTTTRFAGKTRTRKFGGKEFFFLAANALTLSEIKAQIRFTLDEHPELAPENNTGVRRLQRIQKDSVNPFARL